MKPLTWQYRRNEYKIHEGESYKGYTKKFNPPLEMVRHEIVKVDAYERVKEVVVTYSCFKSSPNNAKVEENFSFIVDAVNSFWSKI